MNPHILQTYSSGILKLFPPLFPAVSIFHAQCVYHTLGSILTEIVRVGTRCPVNIDMLFILIAEILSLHVTFVYESIL
jgi:hypothetical protein